MTRIEDVKRELEEYVRTPTIKRLLDDENFQATVAQQYDEYLKEQEYIGEEPNWNLEKFVMNAVEWENSNA